MKSNTLLLVSILASFSILIACTGEQKPKTDQAPNIATTELAPEIELADYMSRLQYFLEKTYWSAKAENIEAFEFYIHEMEESMEDIESAGIMEDGVNVSYNMLHYGIKSLEVFEKRSQETGFANFDENFANLINGCNSCHMVSKKPFIKIQAPTTNRFSSQNFSK